MNRILVLVLLCSAGLYLTGCHSTTTKEFSYHRLKPVPFNKVSLEDTFWKTRLDIQARTLVPYALDKTIPAVENLAAVQKRLRESCKRAGMKIRWVPPPNIHMTMRFLGQITEPMAHALKDMLEPIVTKTSAFELETLGMGAFPDISRPRTIWAGLGGSGVGEGGTEVADGAISGVADPSREGRSVGVGVLVSMGV